MPNELCPIALARSLELTAPGFIVTVYGDMVLPRGEVLSMASLIDICARVGFGENQVRTAVSRLVAAGQLTGERQGRRSFYRLADTARAQFVQATTLLYASDPKPYAWMLLAFDEVSDDLRRAYHMAHVGGACWLAPDWGKVPPSSRLIMRSTDAPGLAGFWDLAPLEARYDRMIEGFSPLQRLISDVAEPLVLRLLLVHAYRGALLRDPQLPASQLPAEWSGARARALFRELYVQLSALAEAQIPRFDGADGALPARTEESTMQINGLMDFYK